MPKVITINPVNITQGHCWSPTTPLLGSPDVYVENFQVVRVGDQFTPHVPGCTHPIPTTHNVVPIMGSPNVFVNGIPVVRDGDPMGCGDVADNGSRTVFVNGGGDGSNNQEEETTGYSVDPPFFAYPSTNLVIPYRVRREGEQFIGGCPVDYSLVDIYTPLNEETTGTRYKNYPGLPLTIQSGANLPRNTAEDRRRPIPITLSLRGNLPGFVSFDTLTGKFSGHIYASNHLEYEGRQIFITAINYVGPTEKVFTITFQKYYEDCP